MNIAKAIKQINIVKYDYCKVIISYRYKACITMYCSRTLTDSAGENVVSATIVVVSVTRGIAGLRHGPEKSELSSES